MSFILLIPVFLSSLLIAAHFMRTGLTLIVTLCFAIPLLLMFAKKWSARIVQIFLILSAAEWIRTLFNIAQARQEMGLPWTRMAVILSVVAFITLASACVFFTKPLKKRYHL